MDTERVWGITGRHYPFDTPAKENVIVCRVNRGLAKPPVMESAPGPMTVIDGRRYLYFAGTGYLGLASCREVIAAAAAAVKRYGIHSATTRSGFGHNPLTIEVERLAAKFFGLESAFYFSSGYAANHIALQTYREQADLVCIDEVAHYSLQEAARLMGKPVLSFKHRDAADLARVLRTHCKKAQRPLVVSDGVFASSGRVTPVPAYLEVLRNYAPAILHLDDAHALGVLGKQGRGTFEHFGLWGPRINSGQAVDGVQLSLCGTLAKALGGFGGIIPGSREFLAAVRGSSHYYEGASAPSSADAGASAKALAIVLSRPQMRRQLQTNIAQLRAGLRELGWPVEDGPTANFSVVAGDAANMRRIHERLRQAGVLVPYMAAYSGIGPEGALRFAVCARHTPAMIKKLLSVLKKIHA